MAPPKYIHVRGVLWIRKFLGLLDPDPDPSIIKEKK
jgi:hypothetical protein